MVQSFNLYLYADDSCFVIQEMRHLHRHNCLNTHLHMQVFRCSECEFSQDICSCNQVGAKQAHGSTQIQYFMYINYVKRYNNNNNIMDLRSISFHFQFDENVLLFLNFL